MKTTLGIIIGAFAGFIIFLALIALFIYLYVVPKIDQFSTGQISTPTSTYTTTTTKVPPSTTLPKSTSLPSQPDVNFALNITDVSGSGLSRTISAQITNTGKTDAHNTWGKIEVFSGGNRIKINGQDSVRVDLGTLKAGSTVNSQVTLGFSFLDGPTVLARGATFKFTIYSDQKTQTFSYDYIP
jgi:hypothetical protein